MIVPNEQAKQECNQVNARDRDKVFQLKWYCSTGVFFRRPSTAAAAPFAQRLLGSALAVERLIYLA